MKPPLYICPSDPAIIADGFQAVLVSNARMLLCGEGEEGPNQSAQEPSMPTFSELDPGIEQSFVMKWQADGLPLEMRGGGKVVVKLAHGTAFFAALTGECGGATVERPVLVAALADNLPDEAATRAAVLGLALDLDAGLSRAVVTLATTSKRGLTLVVAVAIPEADEASDFIFRDLDQAARQMPLLAEVAASHRLAEWWLQSFPEYQTKTTNPKRKNNKHD